jgi:hypothetical protein
MDNKTAMDVLNALTETDISKQMSIGVNAMLGTQKAPAYERSRDTVLAVREVENGRLLLLGHKTYLVPQGTPLLAVIGHALVEAQLEK